MRHDGGDAEPGTGVDVGGALSYADHASGITVELRARGLVADAALGFREWGISGGLGYSPAPASQRGLSLSLRTAHGARAEGGGDELLGRTTLAGRVANNNTCANGRLEAEVGYGLGAFGDHSRARPGQG